MDTSYKLVLYENKIGLFDNSIDATYIIFLEGNEKRLKNIMDQIKKIYLTKKVYILYNKGFKKSKKNKYITTTAKDLVDCNIKIFNHSKKYNYENILILEDDFILSEKILEKNVIDKIDNFIIKNKNTSFSFYLGTIPFLFIPYNLNINRGIINIYTHSVIYSKKYREKVLNYNYKKIYCWDIFQNYFNYNRYFYNIPLVYQPIEDTENSKNWPVPEIIRLLWLKIGKITNSDNKPAFLFKLMYLLSYILSLILLGILIYIIIYIWKKFT